MRQRMPRVSASFCAETDDPVISLSIATVLDLLNLFVEASEFKVGTKVASLGAISTPSGVGL